MFFYYQNRFFLPKNEETNVFHYIVGIHLNTIALIVTLRKESYNNRRNVFTVET